MNYSKPNERDRQLRKVAILIASLDDPLAERMLADMPAADAQAVRATVDRLDFVDPEEEHNIVGQFRRHARDSTQLATPHSMEPHSMEPHSMQGVELDASLLARLEQQDSSEWQHPAEGSRSPLAVLTDAEAATIVDALSREHPQTVAVVISRLDHVAAAKILTLLSPSLQVEVLERVAELDPGDEQSVQVVESHLAQWINQQRQRKQRLAAGTELVQRILQGTPQEDRAVILARLDSRNPKLVERFGLREGGAGESTELPPPRSKISKKPFGAKPQAAGRLRLSADPVPQPQVTTSADPLGELERVDDATLMAALTQTDRQVVILALASAGEELISRILRRLPRRQAKEFRKRLRDIGPTRLSDMLAAQQQLAQHARRLV